MQRRHSRRVHIITLAAQNGGSAEQALVIGAGVAGLSCGLRLHKAGIPFTILESSDGPGGRVRSDKMEGFTLDRGFQIFLTSYPEAKEVLDYAGLDLKPFYAGAMVHYNKQFHKVADPLRHPLDGVQSLFNSTGTVGDKVNVGAFRLKSELGSLEDLLQRDETTTMDRLKVDLSCSSASKVSNAELLVNFVVFGGSHPVHFGHHDGGEAAAEDCKLAAFAYTHSRFECSMTPIPAERRLL